MIVSSVYFWLDHLRHKTENYENYSLEQRRLWKRAVEEEEEEEKSKSCEALISHEFKDTMKKTLTRSKGKSLDSILDTINEESETDLVELRPKRHSICDFREHRKAMIDRNLGTSDSRSLESIFNHPDMTFEEDRRKSRRRSSLTSALETIDENATLRRSSPYERVWECRTLPYEIKEGVVARTSVIFDETVEELPVEEEVCVKYLPNISSDLILWLTELMDKCEYEDHEDFESYTQINAYGSPTKESKFPVHRELEYSVTSKWRKASKIAENLPFSFEKCNKISVDGKTYKLKENDKLQIQVDTLILVPEKGDKKMLAFNISSYRKESDNNKEMILSDGKRTIKVYRDIEAPIVSEKRTLLQKFFRRRSTQEDLVRRGIYKNEPIFGNTLLMLSEKYKTDVPEFVTKVIKLIELPSNIVSQGIYRASGNIATIQKIRLKVDSNKLNVLDEHKGDTDVLAGALKMFFRELKDSLIGRKEYDELVKIVGNRSTMENKYREVGHVIHKLSRPHKETLECLMRHLLKVVEYEKQNAMSIQNMSICWGPSIICFLDANINKEQIIELAQAKNSVVELLMNTYQSTMEPAIMAPSDSMLSLTSIQSDQSCSPRELHRSLSADMTQQAGALFDDKFFEHVCDLIENHRDVQSAYRTHSNDKMAAKIVQKSRQMTSKTLRHLLRKAKIHDLCDVIQKLFDDLGVPIVPHYMFQEFMSYRDDLKATAINDKELMDQTCRHIKTAMNRLTDRLRHDKLLSHFYRVIAKSSNGVSKHHEICQFWQNSFYKDVPTSKSVLTLHNILYAYDPKDNYDVGEGRGDDVDSGEVRRVSMYDNVESFGNMVGSSGVLTNISEENLDLTSCCTTASRPATLPYGNNS